MLSNPKFLSTAILVIFFWITFSYVRLENLQFELAEDDRYDILPVYDTPWTQEEFVAAAMISAVEDDFDQTHIRAVCDAQEWDESVVFTCHGIIGGIGNIRQELLHCIRYAISAGAGLLLPVINLRSESNLSNLENGTAPMPYLFDEDRFLSRMAASCPQMIIYKDLEELEALGPVTQTDIIKPKELPHWPTFPAYSARSRVEEIKAPPGEISLIPFHKVWRYFPICHDSVGFADTFGNLIPFRQDVHYLAAMILYTLHSRFDLPIDPTTTTTSPFADTFLGIHLRTASDVLSYWVKYQDQANYYLSRMESSEYLSSLPIVYIASGNPDSVREFTDEMKSLSSPKYVVTKNDLLSPPDSALMDTLTWDQLALVDYLVLSRSAYFMGMTDSSFAWTLAVQRRKSSESGSCGYRSGFWKSRLLGAAFRDEFSDLVGDHGWGWEDKMWP